MIRSPLFQADLWAVLTTRRQAEPRSNKEGMGLFVTSERVIARVAVAARMPARRKWC